jgi:hypothetical protein
LSGDCHLLFVIFYFNISLVSFYITALTLVASPPAGKKMCFPSTKKKSNSLIEVYTAAETIFNLVIIIIGFIIFMSIILAFFVNLVSIMNARRNELELALDRYKIFLLL